MIQNSDVTYFHVLKQGSMRSLVIALDGVRPDAMTAYLFNRSRFDGSKVETKILS
jgi:hypothetical protein